MVGLPVDLPADLVGDLTGGSGTARPPRRSTCGQNDGSQLLWICVIGQYEEMNALPGRLKCACQRCSQPALIWTLSLGLYCSHYDIVGTNSDVDTRYRRCYDVVVQNYDIRGTYL